MSTITQIICNHFAGIRERNAVFDTEIISAQDIQNVELYYTGMNGGIGIRTTKGNVSVNDDLVGNEKIINIWESIQNGNKNFLVHTESENEGKIYLYNISSDTLTLLKDGLTVAGVSNGFDVVQGWSDLFFFTNGVDMLTVELNAQKTLYAFVYSDKTIYADSRTAPQKLYNSDGSSYSAYVGTNWTISGNSVKYNNNTATYTSASNILLTNAVFDMSVKDRDGRDVVGLIAAIYAGRLFIANKNVIWYSVTSNIYDFTTADAEWETSAGYIETLKDITALHLFLNSLAIFYSDSSEMLSVSNGAFSRSEESPGGCAGVSSLVFHNKDLYFYDHTKKAVFSFQEIINGQKTLGTNIAIDIQNQLDVIDEDNLDKIKALSVFIEDHNEIWWILPTKDNDYSTILIFDYLKGEWVKRKSQKINAVNVINNALYSAGNDGNILAEYNSNTFNGEYIEHYYNCSPCNLQAMNTLKVLVYPPRVSLDMPYTNNFYVKYVKNFNQFKRPKIKYIKSKTKNFLFYDIGHFDEDYYASKTTNAVSKFPNATFKVLEIFIYTTKSTENFAIKNIEFSKIKVKQV